jgi:phage terminase large subunit
MDFLPLAGAVCKARKTRPQLLPTFRGAALEAQSVTEHEWLEAGPAETGKTFSALYRLDTLMRETPRASAVIVRKVRADMNATVLQTWRRVIAIRGGAAGYGGEEAKFYTYPNGARVYICGMDRPGAALSSERDFIFCNQAEQLEVDDWEILSTRTTGRGAVTDHPMLFGDCNPGPPTHWILQRPSLRLLHSRHEDNPTLYSGEGEITAQGIRTMAILDDLTGVRKERLRFGKWVAATGTVYEFDRGIHVIARDEMPKAARYVVSTDFGFTNAFVTQLWAIDHDGRMYLEKEIYRTGRIVEEHAKDIKQMVGARNVEAYVADHDAEDRATLRAHGISTRPAMKAVSVGIQAVQARMAKAPDGKPRLFVVEGALVERDQTLAEARKPVCTEDEFEVYAWPQTSSGKPMKEQPVKENDHGMDAMRYAVMYVDQGPADSKVEVVHGWSAPRTRGF